MWLFLATHPYTFSTLHGSLAVGSERKTGRSNQEKSLEIEDGRLDKQIWIHVLPSLYNTSQLSQKKGSTAEAI